MKPRSTIEITGQALNALNKQVKDADWPDHKASLQLLIDKAMSYHTGPKKEALVFGAGNCNDINLSNLVTHVDYKVTLLDIDKKSLKHAVSQQEPHVQKKLKEEVKDITGLFYNDKIRDLLKAFESGHQIKALEILKSWIDMGSRLCPSHIFNKTFPFIISSTVATQLSSPISALVQGFAPQLAIYFSALSNVLAMRHTKQIAGILADGGVAVITSEYYEWGESKDHGKLPTMAYISNPQDMLLEEVQSQIENRNHYLQGRIKEEYLEDAGLKIIDSSQWLWNILDNRNYLVKGWIVQKS